MHAAESRIGGASRPTILVLAEPYVLATALAWRLQALYNVVAPNLDAGETAPTIAWDAVITLTAAGIPRDLSVLIIELPDSSFQEPVIVTNNHRTTLVRVTHAHPIDDVVSLLESHLTPTV